MGNYRFVTGARFTWQGSSYAINRRLPNGTVEIMDLSMGVEQAVAEQVLRQALFDGDLTFMPAIRHRQPPPGDDEGTVGAFLPWDDYPAPLRTIAEYRLAVLQPLLDQCPRAWPRELVQERVRTGRTESAAGPAATRSLRMALSVSSVYRWRTRYTAFGNDLRALIPATGRRGGKARPLSHPIKVCRCTWRQDRSAG